MPSITVHYHAFLKDTLAIEHETLVVVAPSPTARDVLSGFVLRHPEFQTLSRSLQIAVNDALVSEDAPVGAEDRVDLFPPFGGG